VVADFPSGFGDLFNFYLFKTNFNMKKKLDFSKFEGQVLKVSQMTNICGGGEPTRNGSLNCDTERWMETTDGQCIHRGDWIPNDGCES
jgi:hypothetical protein